MTQKLTRMTEQTASSAPKPKNPALWILLVLLLALMALLPLSYNALNSSNARVKNMNDLQEALKRYARVECGDGSADAARGEPALRALRSAHGETILAFGKIAQRAEFLALHQQLGNALASSAPVTSCAQHQSSMRAIRDACSECHHVYRDPSS